MVESSTFWRTLSIPSVYCHKDIDTTGNSFLMFYIFMLSGVLIPLLIAIFLMELYIQRKKEIATVGAENEG